MIGTRSQDQGRAGSFLKDNVVEVEANHINLINTQSLLSLTDGIAAADNIQLHKV